MAGDDDRRRDGRDARRPDGEKKEQTPEGSDAAGDGQPVKGTGKSPESRGTGPSDPGPADKKAPEGPVAQGGAPADIQPDTPTGTLDDGERPEAGGETEQEEDLPEGFTAPNKEKEKGFEFSQRDDLPREARIHVPDYDQFLAGHGGVPGKNAQKEQEEAEDEDTDDEPVFDEEGWAPLEWEPGLWGAEAQEEDAGEEDEEDDLRHHRFGLRLGRHQAGNFISKLKARFSKEEPADEDELRESEEHEAEQERIEPNERYKEIETYPIRPPYGSIRILFDEETKEYIYQAMEPVLTRTERDILAFIEESLVDSLTVSPHELEDMDDRAFITERFNDVIFDYSIILHEDEEEEDEIKRKLLYYVLRDFIGHGRIDLVMEDPYIEDISCDGPKIPVFLYHRKYESMRSTVIYPDHQELDSFVIKMAQRSSKHISIAEPILDATLPDGSRLQSTLGKEVSAGGSTFTIRKFRPDPFTPPDLVLFRTMSAEMLAYLWIAVQHSSSVLYAGGTASGKTTSLNAILLFIPPQMKIVTIEDTREVNLPHENWIAGITRHGFGPRDQFGRQAGEIDMFQLLKNALRQRPEYIIVGEVRGHEAYSLFQAMATGHAAYGTMHADSVDAVIHRLESDPINVPRNLLEALDVVSVQIQTRVGGKRVRRTKQISEIVGIDPHTKEILTNEVFRWVPKDDSFKFSGISYILERIQLEKALPEGSMVRELSRRAAIIEWMIQKRIQDYREVSRIVSAYYREPEVVMDIVEGKLTGDEIPPGLREIAERTSEESDGNPLSAAALESSKVSMDPQDEAEEDAPGQAEPEAVAAADGPADAPVDGPGPEEPGSPDEHATGPVPTPAAAQAQAEEGPQGPQEASGPSEGDRGEVGRSRPRDQPAQPDPSQLLRSSRESAGKDWGGGPSKTESPPKEESEEEQSAPGPSPVGLWGGGPGLLDAAKAHAQAEEELKRREELSGPEERASADPEMEDPSPGPEPAGPDEEPMEAPEPASPEGPSALSSAEEGSEPQPASPEGPSALSSAEQGKDPQPASSEGQSGLPSAEEESEPQPASSGGPSGSSSPQEENDPEPGSLEGPDGSSDPRHVRPARSHPNEASDAHEDFQPRKMSPQEERELHRAVDASLAAHEVEPPPAGWSPTEAEVWLSRKEREEREKRLERAKRAKVETGAPGSADGGTDRQEDTD